MRESASTVWGPVRRFLSHIICAVRKRRDGRGGSAAKERERRETRWEVKTARRREKSEGRRREKREGNEKRGKRKENRE